MAHCSSWSPVTPLTPTPPMTLPPAMIGNPPGEAMTPGSVMTAGPPLAIASTNARVGRRYMAAALALSTAICELAVWVSSIMSKWTRNPWLSTTAAATRQLFFWHSARAAATIFFAALALTGVP